MGKLTRSSFSLISGGEGCRLWDRLSCMYGRMWLFILLDAMVAMLSSAIGPDSPGLAGIVVIMRSFRFLDSWFLPLPRGAGAPSSSDMSVVGVRAGDHFPSVEPDTFLRVIFVDRGDNVRASNPKLCHLDWSRAAFTASLARASDRSTMMYGEPLGDATFGDTSPERGICVYVGDDDGDPSLVRMSLGIVLILLRLLLFPSATFPP